MILKAVANKNTSSIFELSSFISTVVTNLRLKKEMNVLPIFEVTNEYKHNGERIELFSEILFLFK